MKQDGSIQLFQYWNRLRNGRLAPLRTEIEPADIKSLLADTFILEKDTRGEAVFRLAGSRLCATYGRELKGFSFPSLWREKDQRLVARLAQSVFQTKSVVVISYEGGSRGGRIVEFELLLLPLDGGKENPRSLGAVTACERTFWLGVDPIVDARVDSVRVVDPEREPMFLKNRPSIGLRDGGLAEPPFPADDIEGGRARRFGHLVVLEGGRSG
ncbi:MAG: PAS domain-containing protein [Rhizobiaceae bacterium]|nr:PAS domain-containing protein [Rhizobiaceae bacterium]